MTTALYRRYRPQDFSEVIGQEHVTDPLMQALRSGRIGHAYLFSGPRGCGKTTSARILARCLNCEQGPTPTPCGECESCRALATGGPGSVDVIEIDAASHGGVDDARDLREKAAYGPAQSRYKVYIIDEAHMVTPQGFNALLKIVEEPPEHVKFVFATTEPEKVIGTIRSRTHHYPFRLVPPVRLQEYLEELCQRENVAVEPGVLSFVVRAGGGSVRDSLSVLDQLIAGSDDAGLTYAGAAALLGFTEGELLDAAVDALAAGDGAGMFRQIDRVIETGQDPRRFVEDLLERFRDLIVIAALGRAGESDAGEAAVLRGLPEDQITRMRQQAGAFGPGQLSYLADVINAGLSEMTGATSPRLHLELLCARLLLPTGAGEHGYAARLDRLERRLEVGGGISAPAAAVGAGPTTGESDAPTPRPRFERPSFRRDSAEAGPGPSAPASEASPTPAPQREESVAREEARTHDTGQARQGQGQGQGQPPQGRQESATSTPEGGHRGPGQPDQAQASDPSDQRGRHNLGDAEQPRRQSEQPPAPQASSPAPPRGGVDTEMIRRNWPDVLQRIFGIRRVTWTFLSEHAQVLDYDGTRLLLGLSTKGLATTFRNGPHSEVVRQALSEALGIDTRVEGIPASDAPAPRHGIAQPAQQRPAPQPETSRRPAPAPEARQETRPVVRPDAGPRQSAERPDGTADRQDDPVGQNRTGQDEPRRESAARRSEAAPYDDGRPPPSDDDVPPDEESLPPDPGSSGGWRDRPRRENASPRPAATEQTATPEPGRQTQEPRSESRRPNQQPEQPDRPAQPSHPGAAQAREAIRAARQRHDSEAATTSAGPAASRADHDDDASVDDEDILDSGAVGQPVIASVLGGVVIAEEER